MNHFRERRERFLERIGNGVAVLPAAAPLIKSRDTELGFRQNSDLFYLTGVTEPEAVAVLSPHDPACRFTLFVRPRDPEREVWDGARVGVERAAEQFGADAVHPIGELDRHIRGLVEPADRIWYALGAHPRMDGRIIELLAGFRHSRQRSGRGPTGIEDPDRVLGPMRMVKDVEELACLRRAAEISAEGHLAAIRAGRPGAGEWEIEAALQFAFRAAGATGPAFASIVASGPNAGVLHYVANDRRVEPGELVLVDAGAEYRMYCADITRTWPTSGRFTDAQRAVYDVVLAAEEAGIAAARPGESVTAAHDAALRVLVDGMRELGLLQGSTDELIESGAYKRFYIHQTSHWLGLDVHDVGPYRESGEPVILEADMVLTVEPGLYIPDADDVPPALRGIGVRIEDDVLVTASGNEVLTRGVPVAAQELEQLVAAARAV